jgi:signal transduction histidine kinase
MQQKHNEEALLATKAELETRVRERTAELTAKNEALEAEVAERKRMEGELAEMQRRLLDHAESERLQLARDLHDGPMQDLYGLVFQLEGLPEDFDAGDGHQTVASMKERMLAVIESLRSLSRELRPPALAPYGLEKAIRSHAEALRQAHPELAIDLQLDQDGQALPESTRMALFRIYQTAISNVLRHARASQAWVSFRLTREQACLEIKDNGRGFDLPKRWITLARQGHMGLVGALERAEAAGGALDVVSSPEQGTLIRVTVPR